MTLKVHPLDRLLELEGTRGSTIPYLGYVEVNLQILGMKGYNEDILLLVILTMAYSEKVWIMVGSRIIDRAMGMMKRGTSWGNCDLETGPLQCSHVQVTPAALHRLKGKLKSGKGGHSLPQL